MIGYFQLEFKRFFLEKKNQVLLILLFLVSLFYVFFISPHEQPIEKINIKEIQITYDERKDFLDRFDDKNMETIGPELGLAYAIFPEWNEYDKGRLENYHKKDYHAYADYTSKWYTYSDQIYFSQLASSLRYPIAYYSFGNDFARFDGHFSFMREAEKYKQLAKSSYSLSPNVFEERTAWQALYQKSLSVLPIILLVMTIFFSANILTKENKHSQLFEGYPMTTVRKLIVKWSVILSSVGLSLLVLIPSFVIQGIRFGFGAVGYPVPIYHNNYINNGDFSSISLSKYFLIWMLCLILWVTLIVLVTFILSRFFQSDLLNLSILLLILFASFFYYRRGIGAFYPFEWIPSTYLEFGKFITGEKSYLYVSTKYQLSGMLKTMGIYVGLLVVLVGCLFRKGVKK